MTLPFQIQKYSDGKCYNYYMYDSSATNNQALQ
jgi:hypothetical protein